MYPAGNRNQLWKLKQKKDPFAKILLVTHRIKGRAGEPGLEPRQIGGGGDGGVFRVSKCGNHSIQLLE